MTPSASNMAEFQEVLLSTSVKKVKKKVTDKAWICNLYTENHMSRPQDYRRLKLWLVNHQC